MGSGGLAAAVLSRVCPKGRDEGAPLTGSGRPPDNLAPGRGEKCPEVTRFRLSVQRPSGLRVWLVLGALPGVLRDGGSPLAWR